MRSARLAYLFCFLLVSFPVWPQQTPASSTQAATVLQKSLQALAPVGLVNDVTLSGSARRVAGSDDETGTAVFKAIASDVGRIDLNLSAGPRSEASDLSAAIPTGTWSGPDGTSHAMSFHNLLTEAAWFFPAFAIARRLSTPGYAATYLGQETHNGQTVQHVSVYQTPPSSSGFDPASFAHLTQVDFFLDSATLLPAAIDFNIHPDNNMLLDIPVEIRFGDYRSVAGLQVPYHVQRYINNSLVLDFQVDSVAVNSGLTASELDAH